VIARFREGEEEGGLPSTIARREERENVIESFKQYVLGGGEGPINNSLRLTGSIGEGEGGGGKKKTSLNAFRQGGKREGKCPHLKSLSHGNYLRRKGGRKARETAHQDSMDSEKRERKGVPYPTVCITEGRVKRGKKNQR